MTDDITYFDKILNRLEGDDKLWAVKDSATGFPIWPFIRHRVLFHLMYSKRMIESIPKGAQSSWMDKLRAILFACLKGNPFLLMFRQSKILVFNSGIGSVKQGRFYFNRLADYFIEADKQNSSLVEETAYGRHFLPRKNSMYSHLHFRLWSRIFMPYYWIHQRKLEASISTLLDELRSRVDPEAFDPRFLTDLQVEARQKMKSVICETFLYKFFFSIVKPRLILVEDACYGSRAHLIYAAKAKSITVAEYQHGFINRFHLAYNYGPGILTKNRYSMFFPDHFLSYGDYWKKAIRIPVKAENIGNPNLSEYNLRPASNGNKQALVLGAGVGVDAITRKVLELKQYFDKTGTKTVFRPHPLEWSDAASTYAQLKTQGVILDVFSDLYQSFTESSIIVGELSTALFEAKRFTENVYLIENEYSNFFGDEAAQLFTSVDQGVKEGFSRPGPVSGSSFWEPDWRQRYRRFIEPFLK